MPRHGSYLEAIKASTGMYQVAKIALATPIKNSSSFNEIKEKIAQAIDAEDGIGHSRYRSPLPHERLFGGL
jgi:hypothetical protein